MRDRFLPIKLNDLRNPKEVLACFSHVSYFAFRSILRKNNDQGTMLKDISELRSINDQLQAEIRYLDELFRRDWVEQD